MLINDVNLKEETILEVGKFAILRNIFEKEKCENNCNIKWLEEIAKDIQTSKSWQNFATALADRSRYYWFPYPTYIVKSLDMSKRLSKSQKEKIKDFMENNGTRSIEGGLFAIYRIRNNMYHGLKEFKDLNNQIHLFKAINAVLEEII